MLGRRLAPLVVALGLVGLASTGCGEQSAAARVGNDTLSESDLIDELTAFADNEAYLEGTGQSGDDIRGESAASFSQDFASAILEQRILFMLTGRLFDDTGLELTEADLLAARDSLTGELAFPLDGFPQRYQDQLVEDYAKLTSLQSDLGEGFAAALREVAQTSDIQVSSRYGTFDVDALLNQEPAIAPPDGPLVASDEADEAEA